MLDTKALREVAGVPVERYTSAPLQITKTVDLPASPETVFATLADYAAMPSWFPGMSALRIDSSSARGEGEGVVRVCSFGPAQSMTEDIVLFDAPKKLAYAIRDGNFMGLSGHFALISVEPKGDGSLLTWHQFFNHPDPEAFKVQGEAMLDGAFENLLVHYAAISVDR